MAQVNSCPGQSQVNGNVAVPASPPYSVTQNSRASAVATVVKYAQAEPGKQTATNPQRS